MHQGADAPRSPVSAPRSPVNAPRSLVSAPRSPVKRGFTVLELLLVLSVLAMLVGLVAQSSTVNLADQVMGGARLVAGDLTYGRGLAVSFCSKYRFTFDLRANRYVMRHSGTRTDLATLPDAPWRNPGDPADQYIASMATLVPMASLRIAAVATLDQYDQPLETRLADLSAALSEHRARHPNSLRPATTLEFGELGATTQPGYTLVWVSASQGTTLRYVAVLINPVTGAATIGPVTSSPPPTAAIASALGTPTNG